MASIINVVLPIFALILVGFLCRRLGCLGETASSELNKFVVWLALPALLFEATATSSWAQIWQPGFVISVTTGCILVFIFTVVLSLRRRRPLADASIDGLSAAYANTGYIGIPLCKLVFGDEGVLPAIIATLIVACVLFAVGVILVEISLQESKRPHHAAGKVCIALAKNPLIVAPVLGACWAATGVVLPSPVAQFMSVLGTAATPCALVSLGAFLAHKHAGRHHGAGGMVLAKLILQPLVTAFLAYRVFQLPTMLANSALLLSALPTGTGPFMLASFYRREAAIVSRVILITTVVSVLTVSVCLLWMGK